MEHGGASSPRGDEGTASSSPSSFPFFNHNAATLPHNLPPSIDDKPVARQKRKRTSPEDQAVLETYYACDPKPDKAARLALVKKVALGEKEVQIWFQNRRQTSRRKSRPLLPHEIAHYTRATISSDGLSESDMLSSEGQQSSHGPGPSQTHATGAGSIPFVPAPELRDANVNECSPPIVQAAAVNDIGEAAAPRQNAAKRSPQHAEHITPVEHVAADCPSSARAYEQRAESLLLRDVAQPNTYSTHGHPQRADSVCHLRKVSSFIRLSMNSEGGAAVTAKSTSLPSPPRAPMLSQVAYTSTEGAPASLKLPSAATTFASTTTARTIHRAPSGRSRDSRSWEFWCDKDCRSELEEKAEKDASGSAADAIQLLRSASGRNILGAVPAKRNSAVGNANAAKRLRRDGRGPLQRSSTSNGRLQGKQQGAFDPAVKAVPKMKASLSALSVPIPGNDSDKENWSPGSGQQADDLSVSPDGEATDTASHAGRHGDPSESFHKRRLSMRRGSSDPESDPEIAAFMRAGRESNKVSDHEELDCVQGLLSLSQGNWR